MQKNVAGQKIGTQMVSATDGSEFTSAVTVYITLDAGTQAIGTVGSGVCAHEGHGYHTYAPSQAETNGTLMAATFVGTGAVPVTREVNPTGWDKTVANIPANATQFAGQTITAAAGVTLPSSVASPTNITAGTITTVTNLTNAPTTGDLTATMKTSVQTASDAALVALNLDHLLAVAVPTNFQGAVHDDSVIGHITSTSDANAFVRTTDSLQASRDEFAAAVASEPTVQNIVDGVWNEPAASHVSAGTTGAALGTGGGGGPTAAAIADAVWDEATTGHTTSGTFGEQLKTDVDAILASEIAISARIPAALVSGRMDASVGAMAANVLTAAAAAADLTTELQAGLATSTALTSVASQVTSVASTLSTILADTNELQVDWVNGGRLDTLLDSAAAGGGGGGADPWLTALPGSYGAGTAGKIVGDNVNATISSRATQTSQDLQPSNTQLATALAAADDAVLTAINNLNNLSAGQVNLEMLDVLRVDTVAQPAQGIPAATTSIANQIAYLYKAWRNKATQTASLYSLFNDDGTTVDQKASFSDDETTATTGEVTTGP